MQPLDQFLSHVQEGLARFRDRIGPDGSPVRMFDLDRDAAPRRNEIWIGVGDSRSPAAASSGGALLNNKPGGLASVTDTVLAAPAAVVDGWRADFGGAASPEQVLERATLVVEDASPDSCFALLSFLVRLGHDQARLPAEWAAYIRGWERGDVVMADGPASAYGCLHNALVHQSIEVDPARSWLDGMTLLVDALLSGHPPVHIPRELTSPALMAARAQLAFEEQLYEDSLRQTAPIQLTVPMTGSPGRQRLVDAYLGEEGSIPVGSLKAFVRGDRTRSFLKNGFAVMALFRPFEDGSGNDMTISVDTGAGIDLRDLWLRLEQLEDERWGGSRPSDRPRHGILGYPDGRRPDGGNAPNEPWYDGRNYTLVAAPRRVWSAEAGKPSQLGSRLSWTDVKEQLWAAYQPFRNVRVRTGAAAVAREGEPFDKDLLPLHQCPREDLPDDDSGKPAAGPKLVVAGWHRRSNAEPAFRVMPTLCRYLAACLKRPPGSLSPIRLGDLPAEGSYTVVELPNGVVIVSEDGAFVLDAGRASGLPVGALCREFARARRILRHIESGAARVAKLVRDTKAFVDGERGRQSELALLHGLAVEQLDLATELYETQVARDVPEARLLRDALLARWGVDGRLEALTSNVGLIKDLLQHHSELLAGRRFAFLQTYGLPVVVSSALCGFVFANIGEHFGWPPNLDKVHWPGVLLFVVLSAGGALAIRLYSMLDERQNRRA